MDQHKTFFAVPEIQAIGGSPESVSDGRRRPGRSSHVNPALIPLLRTALTHDLPLKDNADLELSEEKLAPAAATGIILLLSTLLWGAIGLTWWAIVR